MISLKGISKAYGDHSALDGVSLEARGEGTTVVIGPSGCGKSTLLRVTLGLATPDAGEARVLGHRLSADNVTAIRRQVGYVIQSGGLFPHLTARKNATLLPRHLGWSPDRVADRVGRLAELVRLPVDRLDLYPDELSGGQKQRVGLMRALMLDPPVLLLDEPLGALDPMIRAELQGELREMFRSLRKTVVLVTHDLSEAAFLGDRIVLMRAGRVVQEGTLTDLLRRPLEGFVTEFVNAQRSHIGSSAGGAA